MQINDMKFLVKIIGSINQIITIELADLSVILS